MTGRRWLLVGLVFLGILVLGGGIWLLVGAGDDDGREAQSPTAAAGILPITTPGPCPFVSPSPGLQPFENPPEETSSGGSLDTTVTVEYSDPDTTSLAGCPLTLRTYNGELYGPTLRLAPGNTLNLELENDLPVESAAQAEADFEQEAGNAHIVHRPASFNTTNVHYHGLHVSPKGHGDNVLLNIAPQTSFQYEVELPDKHPPGTYWYHAHAHGSTAIQVGSAMAGALIVDDDPTKIPPELAAANGNEKVMLFQSILYDTNGRVDDLTAFFPPGPGSESDCQASKSDCPWDDSQRQTTINGQIVPVINMQPGEVQRWRLIDATFRESLYLQLDGHELHEIALDGIYLGRVDTWSPSGSYKTGIHLEPGYRSDVLVQASMEPGTYDLVDLPVPKKASLRAEAEEPTVLAQVVVGGDPVDMDLPTDAEMAPLAPFGDLNLAEQAKGVQEVIFKLGNDWKGSAQNYFQVNYAAFAPDNVRKVFLNDVDVWRISTVGDPPEIPIPKKNKIPPLPHVFHIHVNPFQVVRQDPEGNDEMVWKDTLLVQGDPVDIYTQYLDYTGKFVLHCHILDHEDLGMMEVVQVVDPLTDGAQHH
jgi:FtsP/CotA-like multicopper oxidase with cupredoxin domain